MRVSLGNWRCVIISAHPVPFNIKFIDGPVEVSLFKFNNIWKKLLLIKSNKHKLKYKLPYLTHIDATSWTLAYTHASLYKGRLKIKYILILLLEDPQLRVHFLHNPFLSLHERKLSENMTRLKAEQPTLKTWGVSNTWIFVCFFFERISFCWYFF